MSRGNVVLHLIVVLNVIVTVTPAKSVFESQLHPNQYVVCKRSYKKVLRALRTERKQFDNKHLSGCDYVQNHTLQASVVRL